MLGIKRVNVHTYERGLLFQAGEFKRILKPGRHWLFHFFKKVRVVMTDCRNPWIVDTDLDLAIASGQLDNEAVVLNLKDYERALVWVDDRFDHIVGRGQYALWETHRKIKVEICDIRKTHFDHTDKATIIRSNSAATHLEEIVIPENHVGVYYCDGQLNSVLKSGRHCFWKAADRYRVDLVDLTEQTVDISGQEIMTADNVSLRLNALVTYQVARPEQTTNTTADICQSLYRYGQLTLRSLVGTQTLSKLLTDKNLLTDAWRTEMTQQANDWGLKILSVGLRDIILPGDMKELFNKVTEAKKSAEANLIVRREETAAMRSQANTAKLLENNPALMRLRELEVLEKISAHNKLNVFLGEKGLTERVVNLV